MELNGSQALNIIILALILGGLVFRQLTTWKRRKDPESTSRMEDGSPEDNEALRRDTESTSGGDEPGEQQYEVFLSFRGSDTRDEFTDILHLRLKSVGIHVFLDSEVLEDGDQIDRVLKAANESKIYVPIFSQDFASSTWCLREVERIAECKKNSKEKKIIPIFYDVEAKDVKLKTDLYKNALGKLIEEKKCSPDEAKRWETALKTVGRNIGRELKGKRKGEHIESIVEGICRKLNTGDKSVTEHLVEDNAQVEAIINLLQVGSDDVCFVGICGLGGSGKTTLATVLYNKLSVYFQGRSFLQDVRVNWESPGGPLGLQKKLLSDFVSSSIVDFIKDVDAGIEMIKRVFINKKALIILDDLDDKEQLKKLAGEFDWFGAGSRIIFTTREESILTTQVASSGKEDRNQPKGILPYRIREMAFDQALKLFCKHAFRQDSPMKGYEARSKDIVDKVGRLPLAVVVIGSHLYDLCLGPEPRGDNEKLWNETFEKLNEGPPEKVQRVLKISYGQLTTSQKEVFLDIACFFTNEDEKYPIIMWDDYDYHPATAIQVLCLRSLIRIRDNKFWMHDQIRDMGRCIVTENSCKSSRVWTDKRALKLLEGNKGMQHVEALSLTSSAPGFEIDKLVAMPELRFLRTKSSKFSGTSEDILSKLRWLSWKTMQIDFQRNSFHFSKLVVLNLTNSDIEDGWDGWSQMKMDSLKVLDLTGCKKLRTAPDFSKFTTLEILVLARCVTLATIGSSIGKLERLKTLNVKGCRCLRELPPEFGDLKLLTEIIMPQNFRQFKFPVTFGNLASLSSLILDEHPEIRQLPDSIGGLKKLKQLSLCGCVGIQKLPDSIGDMEMLVELDLSKSGVDELPDSIGKLERLRVMRISFTKIKKFPETIGQVKMLEELCANKCPNLKGENLEEIRNLSHLRILDLSYTSVSRFPTVLGCLSGLQTLELGSSCLQEVQDLPSNLTHLHIQADSFPFTPGLSKLVSLEYLELSKLSASTQKTVPIWPVYSPEIQQDHWLPIGLSTLKFSGISEMPPLSNLKKLSILWVIEYQMSHFSVSRDMLHLKELKLSKCKYLKEIQGLSCLENLERLYLSHLEMLEDIQGLAELQSLLCLHISHCERIQALLDLTKFKKLHQIELEACAKIRVTEGLKGLELDRHGRTVLERMLDVSTPTWLSRKVPEYEVFLSFRGIDTRYGIVKYLHESLVRNRISVFMDDGELSAGDGVSVVLKLALNDSNIYLPVLSMNYASSYWCLYELAHMVESTSKSDGKKRIFPIFDGVEIADVKLESNLYRGDLDLFKQRSYKEVDEWEKALKAVAEMKGFDLTSNSFEEVIELVTGEVLELVSLQYKEESSD